MNKDRQTLVGVHHIHLIVPESVLAEARHFYLDVLGWSEAAKPASMATKSFWIRLANLDLHIGPEAKAGVDWTQTSAHTSFQVPDIEAVRQSLESYGISTREGNTVGRDFPNTYRFLCEDPWGNTLEFLQFVEEPEPMLEFVGHQKIS
jgi:catechol 2,3-dioxygenase-like lactoylglutathione lyase family enzyme